MGYPTNIDNGPVDAATPVTLESLLSDLRGAREGLQESKRRQERALARLGFRSDEPRVTPGATNASTPEADAISVLRREVDALNYAANDYYEFAGALEKQYSEKAGL